MPKGKLTSEYDFLLKNSDFKRWYENVARGSLVTAHVWLRRVGWIQKKFSVSPETMAKMDSRKGASFIMDVVGTLEKEGKSGSYIAGPNFQTHPSPEASACFPEFSQLETSNVPKCKFLGLVFT